MYNLIKRLIDIIGSFIIGLIFLPIIIITAIMIVIDSQGPILADTPERVGKKGKLFKLYKFRSMIINAHNLLKTDPKYKNLYAMYKKNSYKLYADPRVTRVGHFIRKHSLDELPQIFNVIKGDMSLVGPRPYYPDELVDQQKKYPHTKELVNIVLSARPGITGEWQVSGRSEVNFDKRIQIDAEYVSRKSIKHDIAILLKSPMAMVTGKGAV